ncbi:MAG: hypothetical protein PW999_00660 [Paraburkholderia tropica]|nr:hypothetical protein [Paraburkholderia tropica]
MSAPFVFGTGDAPIAEMIEDTDRVDFLESLTLGQIVELCFLAVDSFDHSLRRAIDSVLAGVAP